MNTIYWYCGDHSFSFILHGHARQVSCAGQCMRKTHICSFSHTHTQTIQDLTHSRKIRGRWERRLQIKNACQHLDFALCAHANLIPSLHTIIPQMFSHIQFQWEFININLPTHLISSLLSPSLQRATKLSQHQLFNSQMFKHRTWI